MKKTIITTPYAGVTFDELSNIVVYDQIKRKIEHGKIPVGDKSKWIIWSPNYKWRNYNTNYVSDDKQFKTKLSRRLGLTLGALIIDASNNDLQVVNELSDCEFVQNGYACLSYMENYQRHIDEFFDMEGHDSIKFKDGILDNSNIAFVAGVIDAFKRFNIRSYRPEFYIKHNQKECFDQLMEYFNTYIKTHYDIETNHYIYKIKLSQELYIRDFLSKISIKNFGYRFIINNDYEIEKIDDKVITPIIEEPKSLFGKPMPEDDIVTRIQKGEFNIINSNLLSYKKTYDVNNNRPTRKLIIDGKTYTTSPTQPIIYTN